MRNALKTILIVYLVLFVGAGVGLVVNGSPGMLVLSVLSFLASLVCLFIHDLLEPCTFCGGYSSGPDAIRCRCVIWEDQ